MDKPEETKDTSERDSSEVNQETSKKPDTSTEELVRKAVSDALSKAGRTDKVLKDREDRLKKTITDAQEAQENWRKQRRESEEETFRDDADALKTLKKKYALEDREAKLALKEAELDGRKGEYEEAQQVVAQSTKERNAREIATRLKVDPETLIKFADTEEAMEELAEKLTKGTETPRPDSGGTTGGGLSDEAFITKLGSGGEPLTKEDLARAKKLGIIT